MVSFEIPTLIICLKNIIILGWLICFEDNILVIFLSKFMFYSSLFISTVLILDIRHFFFDKLLIYFLLESINKHLVDTQDLPSKKVLTDPPDLTIYEKHDSCYDCQKEGTFTRFHK